jgi:hypothetical protein
LDADAILAGQAALTGQRGETVTIPTANPESAHDRGAIVVNLASTVQGKKRDVPWKNEATSKTAKVWDIRPFNR